MLFWAVCPGQIWSDLPGGSYLTNIGRCLDYSGDSAARDYGDLRNSGNLDNSEYFFRPIYAVLVDFFINGML